MTLGKEGRHFRIVLHAGTLIMASALLFVSTCFAMTWHVTKDGAGDFTRVQTGIDAAHAGDTVLVAPGTYVENLQFRGEDIVLRSEDGPSVTTLDGQAVTAPVVMISGRESNDCILEGFTITGGRCDVVRRYGGGIVVLGASPTIQDNIIAGNSAEGVCGVGGGGGMLIVADSPDIASPRILRNVIRNNRGGIQGGGIAAGQRAAATICDNEIVDNVSIDGGGILLIPLVPGSIVCRNQIHNNTASDHGGGILCDASGAGSAMISGNVVYGNTANHSSNVGPSGGGAWLYGRVDFVENTVVMNRGPSEATLTGAGVGVYPSSTAMISRNIIALNSKGGGLSCGGTTITVSDNLAWGNSGADGSLSCPLWFESNGNFQADPLFCNVAEGDFTLPPNSPALTHVNGPIGALISPGCSVGTVVEQTTWSRLKSMFERR